MDKPEPPAIGDVVIYTDPEGRDRNALVCAAWGGTDPYAPINVAYLSSDHAMQDPYGRQVARSSSCIHATRQSAPGNYWRRPAEDRVKPTQPAT